MKKYTTENLESKLKLTKWGSFAIFVFGIIILGITFQSVAISIALRLPSQYYSIK